MNRLKHAFNKASHQGANLFKKIQPQAENIFKKGVQVVGDVKKFAKNEFPEIAEKISEQSEKASNILARGAKVANKIASNPMIQTLPFGSQVAGLAKMTATGLGSGSKLAGQISDVSDLKTYKKGGVSKTIENLADAKRRIELMRGDEPNIVG